MSDSDCTLHLLFLQGDVVSAELLIAASSDVQDGVGGPAGHLPSYVSSEGTDNVPCVSEKELIDGSTPIMIYTGNDANLSPILLLEETDYEMMLIGDVDSVFDHLRDNSGEVVLRSMHLRRNGEDPIFTLRFRGYVGKGFFDVTSNGMRIEIPFEVRSKKIDYLRDYPVMLGDIAGFSTALLMEMRSPLHGEYGLDGTRNDTLYEDFILLDYIFGHLDLVGSYNQVCKNKHRELTAVSEVVPAGMARDIDPSDIVSMISSDNLCPMDGGPIAGRLAPVLVRERNHTDDYDTPENRVVKDLIMTVRNMVHGLMIQPASNGSSYITNRLAEMRSEIDPISLDSWLDEVGDLKTVPYGSTVLQSRSGYSDLFRIYQIIGLGVMFKQADVEDLLKGQNSHVYQVYEYWCYTRLYRSLHSMSENKPAFPLKKVDGRWTMSIRRGNGVEFRIPVRETHVSVVLYYNRKFDQSSNGFRSYSIGLKPDYTLLIYTDSDPGRKFVINFDAKYKAKPDDNADVYVDDSDLDTDCWAFDIYKMHTYRDALLHSFGSYVLYPGKNGMMYQKPPRDQDWEVRDSLVIPSVGAVPLVPGSEKNGELDDVLLSIFSEIVDISKGESELDRIRGSVF